MAIDLQSKQELFITAAELADAGERRAFLDQACGSDHVLRTEIEELLCHDAENPEFLPDDLPGFSALADKILVTEKPGTIIGPYTLLEQIGEGGFGVVFMAEQLQPVRRKVALKIIKPGMDSRQVISRFAAEQHALALMDHPHIARVLDAGATAAGRPYFVMELLHGKAITEYCGQQSAGLNDVLMLFLDVCRAVQHAHQKGVIHRDLKPSNVLVTEQNGEPYVKVIDFGIAKAIHPNLVDGSNNTGFSQMLGTPMYMSPEQATMSDDIDTRSDIYSLGVLLYELLTGLPPFDSDRLKHSGFDDLRQIIQQEEPPLPSVRAASRRTEPSRTSLEVNEHIRRSRHLKNDLDWIVLKAMEKDRKRRYATVGDLENDIRRYLANEPVQARPRSLRYRAQKFARRNWLGLSLTGSALLVITFTIGNLAFSNAAIRKEQARTENAKQRTEQALKLAEDRAIEVREGLERLIAANAQLERGYWYAERHRWDDADNAYSKAVDLLPDNTNALVVRSELRGLLGLWDIAADDYAREMQLHKSELTWRWFRHALLRLHVGDETGYRQACQRMNELFRGTIAPDMASEVVRTSLLLPNPDVDIPQLRRIQEHMVASNPNSWLAQYILGITRYRADDFDGAVASLETSLAATDASVRGLSYPILAMSHAQMGRASEAQMALGAAARCLEEWTQYRCNISDGNWVIHRGATVSWPLAWWDWVEFQIYYREACQLINGTIPADDGRWHVLRARSLAALRRRDEAEKEYAEALKLLPGDTQIRTEFFCNLGDRAIDLRQFESAISHYRQAVELQPGNVALWRFLAVSQIAARDDEGYRQLCTSLLKLFWGTQDRKEACNVLQVCSLKPDALENFDQLEPLLSVAEPDWHFGTWTRAGALYRMGRIEESLHLMESVAEVYRPTAWDWAFRSMANSRLKHMAEAQRCLDEARRWIQFANERRDENLSRAQPAWGAWDEQVQFPLLIEEAETLLRSSFFQKSL